MEYYPIVFSFPSGSGLHYGDSIHISGNVRFKSLKTGQTLTTVSALHIVKNPDKQNMLLAASYFLRSRVQYLYEKVFSQELAEMQYIQRLAPASLRIFQGSRFNPRTIGKTLLEMQPIPVTQIDGRHDKSLSNETLGCFFTLFK